MKPWSMWKKNHSLPARRRSKPIRRPRACLADGAGAGATRRGDKRAPIPAGCRVTEVVGSLEPVRLIQSPPSCFSAEGGDGR